MTDAKDPGLKLLELYLAAAEKVSDRRAQANSWILGVNGAIVGLYGYLQADKAAVGAAQKAVWLWAIPAAGSIVCLAWAALLESYRRLNRAKFAVLAEIEKELPVSPFAREREIYSAEGQGRTPLSRIERWIPACFFQVLAFVLGPLRPMPRRQDSRREECVAAESPRPVRPGMSGAVRRDPRMTKDDDDLTADDLPGRGWTAAPISGGRSAAPTT